jgi:lantibiotic biosynthesis protein
VLLANEPGSHVSTSLPPAHVSGSLSGSLAEDGAFQSRWTPTLPPALATRAVGVARDVAQRLADPQRVALAISAAPKQTAYPRAVRWQAQGMAQGDAGLALSCAYLDACFPDERWDRISHSYLAVATEAAERSTYSSASLFGGLAGLAFAAWSLSRGGTRYQRLLVTLDHTLLGQIAGQADNLERVTTKGVAFGEFDAVSGLAGVGAYLLNRPDNPAAAQALRALLRSLVALARDDADLPRWWTPAHLMGNEETAALYPYGNLNCGLAHGIPGPLALMALALSNGIRVEGMEEVIDGLADWLIAYQVGDAWGVNWPYAVSLTVDGLPEPAEAVRSGSRAAWCYGAPGVARALWLAGVARDRSEWRELAIEAMAAVYRRPFTDRQIDSPTFCHGVAGLLQATLRFSNETRLPMFTEAAGDLIEWLLSAYEPDSIMGYRDWEPGGTRVDQPGLLEGAAGVLLTLLAAATDIEPTWDRAFLLA